MAVAASAVNTLPIDSSRPQEVRLLQEAIALLTRGNDVKFDAGATLEMVIQRDVPLDASRVPNTTRTVATSQ